MSGYASIDRLGRDYAEIQEGADLESVEESGEAIIDAPCLLQFVKKVCRNHVSLFRLILLEIFANTTYRKAHCCLTKFAIKNYRDAIEYLCCSNACLIDTMMT